MHLNMNLGLILVMKVCDFALKSYLAFFFSNNDYQKQDKQLVF